MSQKDQETSYELEIVISRSGKVLGYQALLFKGEEILMAEEANSIPPEPSDSFPVDLTDNDTPEPPLRGIRKALRFFRSP